MRKFKPLMPKKEIEKRKRFQERIYQIMRHVKRKTRVRLLGKSFLILPQVFPPYWESAFLAKTVKKETKIGDFVLDMGTGIGIQAIFAAEKAKKVLATDINPQAIKCAELNAKNHGMANKIKVIRSDLFSKVNGKFDLIIFNPPFRWFKPRDMLEMSNLDGGYRTLTNFFKKAKKYLKENGRIIIVFSTSGDMKYFEHLVKKNNFKPRILAKQRRNGWEYKVYLLTKSI